MVIHLGNSATLRAEDELVLKENAISQGGTLASTNYASGSVQVNYLYSVQYSMQVIIYSCLQLLKS